MSDQNLYRICISILAALFLWFSPRSMGATLLAAGFACTALMVALVRRYRDSKMFHGILNKIFKANAFHLTVERIHLTLLMEFLTLIALVLLVGHLFFLLAAAVAFSWLVYRREETDVIKILPAFAMEYNRKRVLVENDISMSQWYWQFSIFIAIILSVIMLKYPYQYTQWLRILICVCIGGNSLGALIELNRTFRVRRLQ